jgi:hypothetical protein
MAVAAGVAVVVGGGVPAAAKDSATAVDSEDLPSDDHRTIRVDHGEAQAPEEEGSGTADHALASEVGGAASCEDHIRAVPFRAPFDMTHARVRALVRHDTQAEGQEESLLVDYQRTTDGEKQAE